MAKGHHSPRESKPTQQERDILKKLQAPKTEPTVRFILNMTASLQRKQSILAARTGCKKVDIVRVLLEEALKKG